VTAPGNMLIRPDERQVAFVQFPALGLLTNPSTYVSKQLRFEFDRQAASAIEPCLERVKIGYENASPAKECANGHHEQRLGNQRL
jgi:hypothetical protein